MKKKIAYAVFTLTDSNKEYMVKGNFGGDKKAATQWAQNHKDDPGFDPAIVSGHLTSLRKYPNGVFVKRIEY